MERLAYTPLEACEALRIGRTKLYELIGKGDLRAVALGGKTLIPRVELETFIASLPWLPSKQGLESKAPLTQSQK